MLNYLDLTTTDPAFNLAVEEYVFDHLPKDRMYVLLWQNDNAIIIGKHQNTHAQINETFVKDRGIRVIRRLSGGGAVYHDLGNLNFTVIADAHSDTLDFGRFCDLVILALKKMDICAERNGRNDMTVEGKKFSGNAQYIRDGRVMHHGTLLFDSNLTVLSQALQVDEEKISAKGVDSVRSRVTNLRPLLPRNISLSRFRQVLLDTILEQYSGTAYDLTEADLATIEEIKTRRYDTWQWNYGRSPACTIIRKLRKEGCGTVEAHLSLSHGIIENLVLTGDFFSADPPEHLCQKLIGCPLTAQALTQALCSTDIDRYLMGMSREDFLCLLTQ